MKKQWQQLDRKDKQLLSLLVAILLLACGYWLLWLPLQTELVNMQRKVKVNTQMLADVKAIGQKITTLQGGKVNSVGSGDLNQLVSRSAAHSKIVFSRIQVKSDSIQIWIDDVNFNQFISWLENLNKQYGIEVQNIDISVADAKGMIKVRRLQLGKRT